MLGITWRDRKRSSWTREQATIRKKKWTWEGHIMHRTDNRWTAEVTEWGFEGLLYELRRSLTLRMR